MEQLRLCGCTFHCKAESASESESEVRMPKRQPSLGREPGQKLRNYEQSVKRARLFCTEFHELIRRFHPPVSICSHLLPIIPTLYSRELFEFASPIHCRASHRSSSKRLPMQHSACPTFMRESHYVASKFPLFRNAVFCPCFHVTRINHFSHALIPIMQNFVPRISPANPAWSSNQRAEHTSKMENAWARKDGNFLLLALDWAKAFDSISPAGLVIAMLRFGIPYHFCSVVCGIYNRRHFMVRDGGATSHQHPQCFGISQGCALSRFLFPIVMTMLIQDAQATFLSRRDPTRTGEISELMYGDDTLIVATNKEDAQIYMQCIEQAGRMHGLQLIGSASCAM